MNDDTVSASQEELPPRFSPQVETKLKEAGWFSGRIVPETQLEQWMVIEWEDTEPNHHFQTRMFSAPFHILREFGGLLIEQDEPGVTCYRETFKFDPMTAVQETQSYNWPFAEWEADGSLFPIGRFVTGRTSDYTVAVDGRGRIVDEEYCLLLGNNIEEALENIIVGIMPKPLPKDTRKAREASEVFPMMRKRLGLK